MIRTTTCLTLILAALLSGCSTHDADHAHAEHGHGHDASADHHDDGHDDDDGHADAGDGDAGEHASAAHDAAGVYALSSDALAGGSVDLADYAGKVTLVVNVASKCGYTPQYAGLQELHERLGPAGFAVLGFPSNEFGGQEPGSASEIQQFCSSNYGVEFPLFAKCVTGAGADQSPVYALLGEATGKLPNWNFCKYLVGRDGQVIGFYPSKVAPGSAELLEDIEAALAG